MSNWWKKGVAFPSNNPNFIRIIDFYLFNCPVQTVKYVKKEKKKEYHRVSARAQTFEETVWTKGNLNTLLTEMKRNKTYIPLKDTDNVEEQRKSVDGNSEFIVFKENSELKKLKSIFYAIRNAFAHGSFSIVNNNQNTIYYLESAKDEKIKSQIKLKESTLLDWIDLFNSTPDEIREKNRERKKQNRKARGKKYVQTNQ
jgi:hypothetical protein